jgi:hypothetical protein
MFDKIHQVLGNMDLDTAAIIGREILSIEVNAAAVAVSLIAAAVLARLWMVRRTQIIRLGKFCTGSVYIFRDKSCPGIIKIGMTKQACMTRKEQVSRTMADGGELAQVYAIDNVPFPLAVEQLAHLLLSRSRVKWPAGSSRGVEWFHARNPAAVNRAIAAVEKAARRVRFAARREKRWPDDADGRVAVWRLSQGRVLRYRLF